MLKRSFEIIDGRKADHIDHLADPHLIEFRAQHADAVRGVLNAQHAAWPVESHSSPDMRTVPQDYPRGVPKELVNRKSRFGLWAKGASCVTLTSSHDGNRIRAPTICRKLLKTGT